MPSYRTIRIHVQAAQFDGTNGEELGLRQLRKHPYDELWVLDSKPPHWASVQVGEWVVAFEGGRRQLFIDEQFRKRFEEVGASRIDDDKLDGLVEKIRRA